MAIAPLDNRSRLDGFQRPEDDIIKTKPIAVLFDDENEVETEVIEKVVSSFGMRLDVRIGFGPFSNFWDDSLTNRWVPQLLLLDLELLHTPSLAAIGKPEIRIEDPQQAGILLAHNVIMEQPIYDDVPILFVSNYPVLSSFQAHKARKEKNRKIASAGKRDFEKTAPDILRRWFSSAQPKGKRVQFTPEEYEELWRNVCDSLEIVERDQLKALGIDNPYPIDALTAIEQMSVVRERIDCIVDVGFFLNIVTRDREEWLDFLKTPGKLGLEGRLIDLIVHGSTAEIQTLLRRLRAIADGVESD